MSFVAIKVKLNCVVISIFVSWNYWLVLMMNFYCISKRRGKKEHFKESFTLLYELSIISFGNLSSKKMIFFLHFLKSYFYPGTLIRMFWWKYPDNLSHIWKVNSRFCVKMSTIIYLTLTPFRKYNILKLMSRHYCCKHEIWLYLYFP